MAGLRVALDAQERRAPRRRECLDDGLDADRVEDLARVPLDVRGRELGARALSDAAARVLGVLELAQLGRWATP